MRKFEPGLFSREMRASAGQIKRGMERQGYALVAEHDFLPYQCFLVFRPQ